METGSVSAQHNDSRQSQVAEDLLSSWAGVMTSAEQRAAMNEQLRQDFRKAQQLRRAKRAAQVHALTLGKGLGAHAEQTLLQSCYNPAEVFGALAQAEREMWMQDDLLSLISVVPERGRHRPSCDKGLAKKGTAEGAANGDASVAPLSDDRASVFPLLCRMRVTTTPAKGISDVQTAIEDNLSTLESELDVRCAPFTFREVLNTITQALLAMERGYADERVTLEMYMRKAYTSPEEMRQMRGGSARYFLGERRCSRTAELVGAREVADFVAESVIPVAYRVVHGIHMVQWIGQYTMTFLRTLEAQDRREAEARVELLARCVRLLGMTENFSAVLLSIQSKVSEYDAFDALRANSEQHVTALLDHVENTLDAVLAQSFPSRRRQVRLAQDRLRLWLQRALFFLSEINTSWAPNVYYHISWKNEFLSRNYFRIHTVIASKFLACTLGFVDEDLYKLVRIVRVPGHRYYIMNAARFPPDIPNFMLVEKKRVEERCDFSQIGMDVKSVSSKIVGQQLCMSSRYILGQATAEYDKAWGFEMHEPTVADEQERLARKVAQVVQRAQARLQLSDIAPLPEINNHTSDTARAGGTFLTQTEEA